MIYSEKYRSVYIRFGSKYYSHLSAKLGQHFRACSVSRRVRIFEHSFAEDKAKIRSQYCMYCKDF